MLSGKDLIHALAVIPPYNDSDRDRSTGERLQLLSSLYEFYQPLSMTIDLYCEIYTAMQHCYGQYSPQSEAAAFQNGYSLMHGNALAASIGGGNSFSVVGVSGLGKSTALQRVLSLYPQVIEHTEYHGQKFYCHQISYLVVQTPHDASIKALILDIYLQIDSLIGTTYQKDALSRRLSIHIVNSKRQNVVIVDSVNNRIGMQRQDFFAVCIRLTAKRLRGGFQRRFAARTGIGRKNRRTRKAKQVIILKILDNILVHIAKLAAMALVKNQDNVLLENLMSLIAGDKQRQLLNRCDDDFISMRVALGVPVFQLALQHLRGGVAVGRAFFKAVIFFHGLVVQILAVYHEQNFINVGEIGGQLRRFEGCQRFAAARGMPDVPACG